MLDPSFSTRTHRSHTKTSNTAGFIRFNLVPMADRFMQKTQSGEETLSNCDAGVLLSLNNKFMLSKRGKLQCEFSGPKEKPLTRLFFQHK